jgi:hypothetical protein
MNLREGSPCPIAALARKSSCLGSVCAWHLPKTQTGCLIMEQNITFMKIVGLLGEMSDVYVSMEGTLKQIVDELKQRGEVEQNVD